MHTETFSYLPPLTDEEIKKQVEYILKNGWIPGIEYTDEPGPHNSYWSFWKLPFFNAETAEEVMEELEACREANPDCYIKITGYDNIRQGQVLSFVAYRP
nr:Chain B, RubisCO small subunit [synthetic construct]7QSY_D Chain D, RubisCO small subunit [synthetic construct]7QSY_F Chain F, RubisCO small subunit [synthetic construct]7QSY_H Chain H, RubisCO small subunit [synthetic construct]